MLGGGLALADIFLPGLSNICHLTQEHKYRVCNHFNPTILALFRLSKLTSWADGEKKNLAKFRSDI